MFKYKIFQFTDSPLKDFLREQFASQNQDFYRAYYTSLSSLFAEDIEFRATNKKNLIVDIYGDTRSGKSSAGLSLLLAWYRALKKDKLFPSKEQFYQHILNNICFTTTEILDRVKALALEYFRTSNNFKTLKKEDLTERDLIELLQELQIQDMLILDEQRELQKFGFGALREEAEMNDIEMITAKTQLSITFISPIKKPHISHYSLKALDIDKKNKVNRLLVFEKDFPSSQGFVIFKKPPEELWQRYELKKNYFIAKVMMKTVQDRNKFYLSIIKKCKEDPDYKECKNKIQRFAYLQFEYPTLSDNEKKIIEGLTRAPDSLINKWTQKVDTWKNLL
ncbi:MAG: hypothetical protein QXO57_02530 [Candidatus Aenigmatarchaeota archaeon]